MAYVDDNRNVGRELVGVDYKTKLRSLLTDVQHTLCKSVLVPAYFTVLLLAMRQPILQAIGKVSDLEVGGEARVTYQSG